MIDNIVLLCIYSDERRSAGQLSSRKEKVWAEGRSESMRHTKARHGKCSCNAVFYMKE